MTHPGTVPDGTLTPARIAGAIGRSSGGGLATVLVVLVTSALSLGMLMPVLPLFFSDRGASARDIGFLVAVGAGVEGGFEGAWGWVSDGVSVAPILIGRMFALAGLLFAFTLAGSLSVLYLLQFLRGIVEAAVWPVGRAYVGRSMPPARRGLGMAVAQSVIICGLSVGALAGGVVKDRWGYDAVFYAALGLLLAGGAVAALRRPTLVVARLDRPATATGGQVRHAAPLQKWRARLGAIALVTIFANLGWGVIMAFVPLYGTRALGLDATRVGTVLLVSGLAGLLAVLPAGGLSDRVGRKSFIVGGLAVYSAGIAAIGFTGTLWSLAACTAAAAVGRACTMPATLALVSEVMPPYRQGQGMGLLGVAEATGALAGPALGGLMWEARGAQVAFWSTGAAMAAGAAIALALIRERHWLGGRRPAATAGGLV